MNNKLQVTLNEERVFNEQPDQPDSRALREYFDHQRLTSTKEASTADLKSPKPSLHQFASKNSRRSELLARLQELVRLDSF